MTEKEFHKARRMWAVVDGKLLVAAPGDGRTHYEWLLSVVPAGELGPHWPDLTRGYVLNGRLVAYKGDTFSRWVNQADVVVALDGMRAACGPIDRVCLGVRVGRADEQPWPVQTEGDADQYREFVTKKHRPGGHSPY